MIFGQNILPAMIVCALFGGASLLATNIGAFVYDVREAKRLRRLKRHPYARANKLRPLITIAVVAEYNNSDIGRCIESVFGQNYRNMEVLVIDQSASKSIGSFIRSHNKLRKYRRIQHLKLRNEQASDDLLADTIESRSTGELIITMPANCILAKNTLNRLAQRFSSDQTLQACHLDERISDSYSIAGLFKTYLLLLERRKNKYRDVANMRIKSCKAVCYRDTAFRQLTSNDTINNLRVGFAGDAAVETPGSSANLRKIPNAVFGPGRQFKIGKRFGPFSMHYMVTVIINTVWLTNIIIRPFLLTFLLYLALKLHQPALLFTLIGVLCAAVVIAIWDADQLHISQKISLSLSLPSAFILFYATTVYELLAMLLEIPIRTIAYIRNHYQVG